MSQRSTYKTLVSLSEGLYKEKGSKFIGLAIACYTEQEAKTFLDIWRKEHYQARHLCYAYRFGVDQKVFRANDDGEPNNSAGAPILGQIQSFDLSNVLIGVVRYYGGTKLGVGGLIQAYKTAAKEAIENGKIIELEVFEWVKILFDYSAMPHVMNLLKQYQMPIKEQVFENDCSIITILPLNSKEFLKEEIKKINETTIEEMGIY
ncbi:MAG: hypothetical protein RI883_168 [Bacteroidota bacterium]|jgi:uncharacterized YigZ family protein